MSVIEFGLCILRSPSGPIVQTTTGYPSELAQTEDVEGVVALRAHKLRREEGGDSPWAPATSGRRHRYVLNAVDFVRDRVAHDRGAEPGFPEDLSRLDVIGANPAVEVTGEDESAGSR